MMAAKFTETRTAIRSITVIKERGKTRSTYNLETQWFYNRVRRQPRSKKFLRFCIVKIAIFQRSNVISLSQRGNSFANTYA